jgi:hypothetical protein
MSLPRLLWLAAGLVPALLCAADAPKDSAAQSNPPATITAGPDWIALRPELEIQPGSALDFSGLGFTADVAADPAAGARMIYEVAALHN